LGLLLIGGFAAGIIFWGGFHTTLEWTNTEKFCISCHEMEENVYEEFEGTIHHTNRTGVRATCPDCHVPREWFPKVVRKVRATNELYHKLMGSIGTPKKFEAKRLELAKHVWVAMKATDSRECRNCHTLVSMALDEQTGRARRKHEAAEEKEQTCIDCHKGIAHELPEEYEEEEEG
jgi:cytochrome c-type protein NapC